MSLKYINGSGAPRVRVKAADALGNLLVIQTYNFPLTGAGGLHEQWTSNDVEGESIDLDTLQPSYEYYEGYWRGSWTADYSPTLKSTYSLYVQDISNYARLGYEIWLMPRVDRPDREYKVKMINKFDIGINKGGTNAMGNTGFFLNFVGLDTFKYGQWVYGDTEKIVLQNFSVI